MSIDRPDPDLLAPREVLEISNADPQTNWACAVEHARRAADQAVMAIFELAFSLESLADAIGYWKAEARRQLQD